MMTFEQWMDKVNGIFLRKFGLGRDDFPDNCYWDMWNDGDSPQDAFRNTLESEGFNDFD